MEKKKYFKLIYETDINILYNFDELHRRNVVETFILLATTFFSLSSLMNTKAIYKKPNHVIRSLKYHVKMSSFSLLRFTNSGAEILIASLTLNAISAEQVCFTDFWSTKLTFNPLERGKMN